MKDVKYQLETFAFYDKAAIEEKMSKMASKGWLVEKPGNLIWRYRRIQPKDLNITVTYFADASDFDPAPTEGQQIMEEYASKDSWNIAARWGQMQIFYSEEVDPTPIETDAVVQVQNIHSSMKKNMLPTHFFLLALCIFELFFCGWQFNNDPVDFLSSPYSLYMVPMWIFTSLSVLLEIILYYSWYKKARRLADETGAFLNLRTNHAFSWVLLLISLLIILCTAVSSEQWLYGTVIWLVITAIVILFIFGIKWLLKKDGTSRGLNRFITILSAVLLTMGLSTIMMLTILEYNSTEDDKAVGTYDFYGMARNIYNDSLPLVVEDLMKIDTLWTKEADDRETFLLARTECYQRALSPEESPVYGIEYTILDIKWNGIYSFCKDALLNDHFGNNSEDCYLPIDATLWDASEAYRLHWCDAPLNTYLICWENRIVIYEFSWEPTPEQMEIAAQKLNIK